MCIYIYMYVYLYICKNIPYISHISFLEGHHHAEPIKMFGHASAADWIPSASREIKRKREDQIHCLKVFSLQQSNASLPSKSIVSIKICKVCVHTI